MKKKNETSRKGLFPKLNHAKVRGMIIKATIFLTIFAAFAVAYYNIPALKEQEINGTVLKGILSEKVVLPEVTETIKIGQGETYTFDVYVQYADKNGNSAQGEIADKSELEMYLSDSAICERPAYNQICICDDVTTGTCFTVTLCYGSQSAEYNFMVAYSLEDTIDENQIVTNPDDIAVLVNQSRYFASSYSPSDLVEPSIQFKSTVSDSKKQLRSEAATAAEKLFLNAKNDGISLIALKGYVVSSSDPEHQSGLSLDVTSVASGYSTSTAFAESEEGQWLAENAHLYGFILRYPEGAEDITGFDYSPSHLRYVGVDLATYLYVNNLTLEEYLIR